jgi:pyruvate/2-oxoacid:ferredoxin oxidoreductase beta subunit
MKNWMLGLAFVCVIPECVTINIYFPAAAAEKAADKIIDEVWQLKNGAEKPTDKQQEPAAPSAQ